MKAVIKIEIEYAGNEGFKSGLQEIRKVYVNDEFVYYEGLKRSTIYHPDGNPVLNRLIEWLDNKLLKTKTIHNETKLSPQKTTPETDDPVIQAGHRR